MRKILIATAAAAGLMALGACQPATTEDETDMAEAADESAMEASAEGGSMAEAAGDSGSDASAPGGSMSGSAGGSMSGDTATPAQPMSPTAGQTDPMVTGQGSTSGEGNIQMGSEPPHPARQ